jgi:hypothetical protein
VLKPVRSRTRTAHPNIIKVHDSAGAAAERDRLPAFGKNRIDFWAAGAILRPSLDG